MSLITVKGNPKFFSELNGAQIQTNSWFSPNLTIAEDGIYLLQFTRSSLQASAGASVRNNRILLNGVEITTALVSFSGGISPSPVCYSLVCKLQKDDVFTFQDFGTNVGTVSNWSRFKIGKL